MRYAAWLPRVGARGAFASYGRRIIVADTTAEISNAFGELAEPVELTTITVTEWLEQEGFTPPGQEHERA
jgi:hypothetical protein